MDPKRGHDDDAWDSARASNKEPGPTLAWLRERPPDDRHVAKHLPNTPAAERLLRRDGAVHLFTDRATMDAATRQILDRGESIGVVRGHERWGIWFTEPIGFRLAADGTTIPLSDAELKVNAITGRYHVVPRTGPSGR